MAGPYYVDIGTIGAWNARNGLSSGACWYGITGLQKAFDTAVASEIVYIKGTGNVAVNYSVPYDANTGNLTDGEAVTWHDGAGVVHFNGAMATPVQIELSSGNAPSDGDTVTGTTSTSTITAHTTIAIAGLDLDINGGTNAAGWVKYIGVNSSWAVDGTRAIVTGSGTAGVTIFTWTSVADLTWMENIEATNTGGSAKIGFTLPSATNGCVFINCCANNCSGVGFSSPSASGCMFYRCVAYSNTSIGFNGLHLYLFCCARDNTTIGFYDPGTAIGCVSHGNTDDGYYFSVIGSSLFNCVSDGNGDDGVAQAASTGLSFSRIIGCRITNHSGAGDIGLMTLNEPFLVGHCYFEDNSSLNIQGAAPTTSGSLVVGITYCIVTYVSDDDFTNVGAASNASGVVFVATGTTPTHWAHGSSLSSGPNSTFQFIPIEGGSSTSNLEDLANTDEGYVDKANHDFSTRYVDSGDPDLRRVAITIPWT